MCTSVQTQRFNRQAEGFTSVELMCVMALLAIVVTLALPSFTTLIQKLRVRQAIMELKGALYLARSEAVRRSEDIKLRKRDAVEDRNCASLTSDWSCGWIIFLDGNGNSTFDGNSSSEDELLRTFPTPTNTSVRFTSNASVLTVNRWGAINGIAASFVISPSMTSDESLSMTICISSGGRVRTVPGNSCS